MRYKLEIDCGNSAFMDEHDKPAPTRELSRILKELSQRICDLAENGDEIEFDDRRPIFDKNGNTVGHYILR